MYKTDSLSTYEAIHAEIKRKLVEIDSLVFAYYPHFEYHQSKRENDPFVTLLDQLSTLKENVNAVKKAVYTQIEFQSTIGENTPL